MDKPTAYETYVLRCRVEYREQGDDPVRHFILIDAGSGGRRVFPSLEKLLTELQLEFAPDDESD